MDLEDGDGGEVGDDEDVDGETSPMSRSCDDDGDDFTSMKAPVQQDLPSFKVEEHFHHLCV